MKYYVYAYKTPVDIKIESLKLTIPANEYFYVGKGKDKRMYDHLNEKSNRVKNHLKHSVIQKIFDIGKEPIIEILSESDNEEVILETEINYIDQFGRIVTNTGFLTNLTDGGEGTTGHKHSEELKEHWSKIRKGRTPSNKGIKRPGVGGRPKGTKWTKETRKKIMSTRSQEGYYDYCKDIERRKKISESKKGCKGSALGKKWYNNGIIETYQNCCPDGFNKGRLKRETNGKKGMFWYTNGIETKQYKEGEQPKGWKRGRILRK
jgi:hypothetical protein